MNEKDFIKLLTINYLWVGATKPMVCVQRNTKSENKREFASDKLLERITVSQHHS